MGCPHRSQRLRSLQRTTSWVALLTAALCCGCSSEEETEGPFTTGSFWVQTRAVDDQCLDGGLNLLFMPYGTAEPWPWPFPIEVHQSAELPLTYPIHLREPFGEMIATANAVDDTSQHWTFETNVGVLLGEDQFGQCVVDMVATADMSVRTNDLLDGEAQLGMLDPRGDERCPADMPASCDVTLVFVAERAE